LINKILKFIDFDPFVEIEDAVILLDTVLNRICVTNFDIESLRDILRMESVEEKLSLKNIKNVKNKLDQHSSRSILDNSMANTSTTNTTNTNNTINTINTSNTVSVNNTINTTNTVNNDKKNKFWENECLKMKNEIFQKIENNNLIQFSVNEKLKIIFNKEGKIKKSNQKAKLQ